MEWMSELVYLTVRVLWATDWAPGNEMKDDSGLDFNTPGLEPGNQRSVVEWVSEWIGLFNVAS